MTKRVVVRVAARGYVDGRYIGEEKEVIEAIDPSGRGKRKRGKTGTKSASAADNRGNRIGGKGSKASGAAASGKRGTSGEGRGNRSSRAEPGVARNPRGGRGAPRPAGGRVAGAGADGNTLAAAAGTAAGRGRDRNARARAKPRGVPAGDQQPFGGNANALPAGVRGDSGSGPPRARKNRGGKKTPFRTATPIGNAGNAGNASLGPRALISEVAETRRWRDESKSGQFAEALAKEAIIKRERLHKVLAQSGHGSRRDMEIMISSGRVMVNGIVATIGTTVSPADAVKIDQRLVKLKFSEELPRVLLYHKPEGEIVTTNDPGNRITVFDNLPRVENGKWMSVGRLDINTSGLLIFTTSGELANRLMHPRYEVEREYAVRVLGELNDEQTQRLLSGVSIALDPEDVEDEDEVPVEDRPAKFDSIDKRGGEGVNQWYHVVLKEGRNREVRKMFEAVGFTVSRLMRVRFGKIGLPPRLTRGKMLELDESQARAVLRWVGMEVEGQIGQLPTNGPPRPVHISRREREHEHGESLPADVEGGADSSLGNDVPGVTNLHAEPSRRGRGRRARGKRGALPTPGGDGQVDALLVGDAAVESFANATEGGPSTPPEGRPAREGRRGRGRNLRRGGGGETGAPAALPLPGREGPAAPLMREAAAHADEDSIGNAIPSVMPRPTYDDIDDSIGNRIVPAQADKVHRSSSPSPRGPAQEKSDPRRGARRRRGGPRSGGGQGNTL